MKEQPLLGRGVVGGTLAAVLVLVGGAWIMSGRGEPADRPARAGREERSPDVHTSVAELPDASVRGFACSHPYVPARVGDARGYEVTVTTGDEAQRGRVDMRVIDVEPGSDAMVVVWETTLEAPGLLTASSFESRVRCGRESSSGLVGAEEPWFGASLPGATLENRWRWPLDLQEGTSFGGTAHFAVPGAADGPSISVTRHHRVEVHEEITTPAGRFGAWRVAYDDETVTPAGTQRSEGTLWVASRVGLVQSVTRTERSETRWRLDMIEGP